MHCAAKNGDLECAIGFSILLFDHCLILYTKPVITSTLFFMFFTSLFLAQLVNLGIYPIKPAILFLISTFFGLPFAIYVGVNSYERYFNNLNEYSTRYGELRLSIPMLYLNAKKIEVSKRKNY